MKSLLPQIPRLPALALGLLALLSGCLWRLEIELRWGWAGLDWISDFHFSALLICLLFAAWLYFLVPCQPTRYKGWRSFLALGGGLASYLLYEISFTLVYNRFPLPLPIYLIPAFLVLIALPLSVCLLAWFFSPAFPRRNWLLVPILFLVSFPFASFLLILTDHPGGSDPVHAVKSGFVFLGLLTAAGLPFLPGKKTRPKEN